VSSVPSRQIEHGAHGEEAPPAAPAPAPISHLRELDALRGVAILLVFLYHCDSVVRPEAHGGGPLFAFVRAGHTGVSLFFVLSGFLLAFPFLAEAEGGRHVRRREYALRRAMRILPMYYLAILVALWWTHPVAEWASSWPFLVFLNPLAGPFALWPFSIGWWSLCTEVQFYLLLPLLPLLARTAPRAFLTLGAYTVAYILFMLHLLKASTMSLEVYLHYAVFGRAPLFLSGIAAAWLWRRDGAALRHRLANSAWMARGGADALLLLAAAALSWILQWVAWVGFWQAERQPDHIWHVAEGILWATILLLLLAAPLRSKRLIVNPVLGWVGLVSYSLFLIHVPAVTIALHRLQDANPGHFTRWNAESLAACVAILAACLLLSTLTYWAVERPFLRRKARLAR
jgi:peptidoglycan/LPS O-acetylase OafA/YrhL